MKRFLLIISHVNCNTDFVIVIPIQQRYLYRDGRHIFCAKIWIPILGICLKRGRFSVETNISNCFPYKSLWEEQFSEITCQTIMFVSFYSPLWYGFISNNVRCYKYYDCNCLPVPKTEFSLMFHHSIWIFLRGYIETLSRNMDPCKYI